ncbi:unnamed protein product [Linum tenue]|uniref:FHA domain-containing protein n=1 Tax=Linum tenue TaxID=586396 RepID=A0AAV0QRS3_9ROSI|nr:unnamed protein product [Linum tenue]
MVSTRRSGSLSGNNNNHSTRKSSSSSEDKPPSPKRQKSDNGTASEKPMPAAEASKELCPPLAPDPAECGTADGAVAGGGVGEDVSPGKGEAGPAVAVVPPIADGSTPIALDKPRSSFSSWICQKQNPNFETLTPWCKLLSQSAQNPNIIICPASFTIGSSRHCSFVLKDQPISQVLCKIKQTQREGSTVAVLESTGSKGSVQVNGSIVKKNSSRVLSSGDEVVFGLLGNHAYIFQQLLTEVALKGMEVHNSLGKFLQLERRSGDPSAVAGASILASLSSLRQDLSRWKSTGQTSSRFHQGDEVAGPSVQNSPEVDVDALEEISIPNQGTDKAADVVEVPKNVPHDCSQDSGIEKCNGKLSEVLEEKNEWARDFQQPSTSGISLRAAVIKEDIHAGILDGKNIDVSFDNFPYFLSENTKNVLIAASFIHLKHKEHAKYTSELSTVNPRILLSGPAGSEIYQEMLAKALANYFGSKLLIFDSHSFVGGLSSKKLELFKDGMNAEKSCTFAKQSPLTTDVLKNIQSAGEAETPSSSTVPSGRESQAKTDFDSVPSSSGASKTTKFKLGDRVKFSTSASCLYPTASSSRGPLSGIRGKVILQFEDNPIAKVGVKFDKPVPDGVDLGGLCELGHGYFCNVTDLRLENSDDLDRLLINILFEAVYSESRTSPFILFVKDSEKSIAANSDSYTTFKSRLEKLPDNSHPGGLLFTKFGSNQTALLDLAFPDSFGRLHDRGKEVPKATKLLTKLFPNKVAIHMPQEEGLLASWKQDLERDAETLKMKGNLNHLRTVVNKVI